MEDMETVVWNPVIDFLAEDLLDEVKANGLVEFSRFLRLYEPSRIKESMRSKYSNYCEENHDCVAVLTNFSLTIFTMVKDKNTPAFRHAIDKHFIDRKNQELAGRFRASERHRSFMKSRLLAFVSQETRARQEEPTIPRRRM